jgi:hypothetical protein
MRKGCQARRLNLRLRQQSLLGVRLRHGRTISKALGCEAQIARPSKNLTPGLQKNIVTVSSLRLEYFYEFKVRDLQGTL